MNEPRLPCGAAADCQPLNPHPVPRPHRRALPSPRRAVPVVERTEQSGNSCSLPSAPAPGASLHQLLLPPGPGVHVLRCGCPRPDQRLLRGEGSRMRDEGRPRAHFRSEAGAGGRAWVRFCDALPGVRSEGGKAGSPSAASPCGRRRGGCWPPGPGLLRAARHGVGGASGARGRGEVVAPEWGASVGAGAGGGQRGASGRPRLAGGGPGARECASGPGRRARAGELPQTSAGARASARPARPHR